MSKLWGRWTWCPGSDPEVWEAHEDFETRQEAIAYGREEAAGYDAEFFQVAQIVPGVPAPPDVEYIIDQAVDSLREEVGEAAGDWDPTREQVDDLQWCLNALWKIWMEEHGPMNRVYGLDNITTHRAGDGVDV